MTVLRLCAAQDPSTGDAPQGVLTMGGFRLHGRSARPTIFDNSGDWDSTSAVLNALQDVEHAV